MLQTKAVMLESAGEISSKAILEAYRYFQIDPAQPDLTDEYIIGCFQSRASASPTHIEGARQQLRVIGVARHSSSIESVASNSKSKSALLLFDCLMLIWLRNLLV